MTWTPANLPGSLKAKPVMRPCDRCSARTGMDGTEVGGGKVRCALCVRFPNRKKARKA